MAYHGYIPLLKSMLSSLDRPRVLEIGLDKGMTAIPLLSHMTHKKTEFLFVGVDILLQDSAKIIIQNLDRNEMQKTVLVQENSLNLLPSLAQEKVKFDIVLIDGDHNYHTVSKEMKYINDITFDHSIVIVDDYHGRWSDKDMWYSEREGYDTATNKTPRVETDKKGVKPAVDEFLELNSNWESMVPVQGEPILLRRKIVV